MKISIEHIVYGSYKKPKLILYEPLKLRKTLENKVLNLGKNSSFPFSEV